MANLEKLLGIARKASEKGFSSLSRFMTWFDRAIDESPKEGQASLDLDSGDCVNIMTIHAAKGLEFPVVFLPEMSSLPHDFNDEVMVDRELGLGTKVPDPDDGYEMKETSIRRIIKRRNREKERAEYRRLLYVAMTRAKDHLVLSGKGPKEHPTSIKDDSTWTELFLAAAGITEADIESGEKTIESEGHLVPIAILSSDDVPELGTGVERDPIRPSEQLLGSVMSLTTGERPPRPVKDRVFTPSMVELYLRCPIKYRERYELGLPEGGMGTSATEENAATKGQIIHEVFRGKDAISVLRRHGIDDPGRAIEYERMRRNFLDSDLIKSALEEHCELPIRFREGGHTYMGTVDRLVRTENGWHIIDYKTGELKKSQAASRAREFEIQMAIYRMGVNKLLGMEARVSIYFPSCDVFEEVPLDQKVVRRIGILVENISAGRFDPDDCQDCRRRYAKNSLHGTCPVLKKMLEELE